MLNYEKCYFIFIEGIILWHLVSGRNIQIEAKIDVITSLYYPISIQEVRCFTVHANLLLSINNGMEYYQRVEYDLFYTSLTIYLLSNIIKSQKLKKNLLFLTSYYQII